MCGHHPLHHPMTDHNLQQPASVPGRPPERVTAQVGAVTCAACGAPVQDDFVFCPHCGQQLLTACLECHRAARADWTHCAFCGADLIAEQSGSPR